MNILRDQKSRTGCVVVMKTTDPFALSKSSMVLFSSGSLLDPGTALPHQHPADRGGQQKPERPHRSND